MDFKEWLINNEKYIVEKDCFAWLEQCWSDATEAAKPRWIPVSERVPDDLDEKIVRYGKYEFFYASYQLSDGGTNGRKRGNWYTLTDDDPIKVTHWLPIPDIEE